LLDVSNLVSALREFGAQFMHYQRRISQYLTSFVFGSGYNIDGFNISTMNTDAFISSLKVIVLFMSLPLTAKEWPWHDPERREPQNQAEAPKLEGFDARIGNALTYLMNAVFVLMTTNYTLNPGMYLIAGDGGMGLMTYFPVVQILLAVVYASLKVYTSC